MLPAFLQGCATSPAPKLTASNDKEELTCGRIAGRMQIRILSLRTEGERSRTTAFSRELQSMGSSVGVTDGKSLDRDSRMARELAELRAMNQQLKQKGCKTYDLDAELKQNDFRVTPRPR